MALAGSVLAAITIFFLGIPALIFVAEAKREFGRS
jgi:cbb3-type cytochrome oxidase subunit 3